MIDIYSSAQKFKRKLRKKKIKEFNNATKLYTVLLCWVGFTTLSWT